MTGPERHWHGCYAATEVSITKDQVVPLDELMANSSKIALDFTFYFLSMFGWDNPSVDVFKQGQDKFLAKLI